MYDNNYWTLTNKVDIELKISKKRQSKDYNDGILINKFIEKYNLQNDVQIFYTDGSKHSDRLSTGIGIAIKNSRNSLRCRLLNEYQSQMFHIFCESYNH